MGRVTLLHGVEEVKEIIGWSTFLADWEGKECGE